MLMIYFITETGRPLPNDTVISVLDRMVETKKIEKPPYASRNGIIINNAEYLFKNIADNCNNDFDIVYYNDNNGSWKVLTDSELMDFVITLNNMTDQSILSSKVLNNINNN
jgi:hypothetical protein